METDHNVTKIYIFVWILWEYFRFYHLYDSWYVYGSGVCDASLIYIQNQKPFRNIKKNMIFVRTVGGVLEFVRSRTMEEGRVKNSDFSRTYIVNDPLGVVHITFFQCCHQISIVYNSTSMHFWVVKCMTDPPLYIILEKSAIHLTSQKCILTELLRI